MDLSQEHVGEQEAKFVLAKDQIDELDAEFRAYDTKGDETITIRDMLVISKSFGGNVEVSILQESVMRSGFDLDRRIDFKTFIRFNQALSKQKKNNNGCLYHEM